MRPLNQPRDVPDAINLLKPIIAQQQIHLLQFPPVARPEAFLDRIGDDGRFGEGLSTLGRLRHLLKELRLLLMVELIERFEDCLALGCQTWHLDDVTLLALPLFRLARFVQSPLPGLRRMTDVAG